MPSLGENVSMRDHVDRMLAAYLEAHPETTYSEFVNEAVLDRLARFDAEEYEAFEAAADDDEKAAMAAWDAHGKASADRAWLAGHDARGAA